MSQTKLYFVEMKVRFAVFEHSGKIEGVLLQIIESIKKLKEAKDHQPLLISEISIEEVKDA